MPTALPTGPRARRAVAAMAAAGALTLLLVGCTGTPAPSPSPEPSSSAAQPIFASDEEALAAAEAAYERYSAISDELSADPTADASAIGAAVTSSYAPEYIESLAEFRASGLRSTGTVSLSDFRLVEQTTDIDGVATVQIYACADYANYRFLNSSGSDVTPTERPTRATMLVHLRGAEPGAQELLVDSTEPWDDSAGC